MNNFNYFNQLKEFEAEQTLVEVHLIDAPDMKVAYLLASNEEIIYFIEVGSDGGFSGLVLCYMENVESIKVESLYLEALSKQISKADVFQKAETYYRYQTDKWSFSDVLNYLQDNKFLVEVVDQNEKAIVGRVVAQDEMVLVLDEYYAENDRRFARAYINKNNITRVSYGSRWLNTIAQSLVDKNL